MPSSPLVGEAQPVTMEMKIAVIGRDAQFVPLVAIARPVAPVIRLVDDALYPPPPEGDAPLAQLGESQCLALVGGDVLGLCGHQSHPFIANPVVHGRRSRLVGETKEVGFKSRSAAHASADRKLGELAAVPRPVGPIVSPVDNARLVTPPGKANLVPSKLGESQNLAPVGLDGYGHLVHSLIPAHLNTSASGDSAATPV